MVEQICRNCDHWEKKSAAWGRCSMLGSEKANHMFEIQFGGVVDTSENFGCELFGMEG